MNLNLNLNLNRRERLVVIAAGIFIAGFILFNFIVAPVFDKRNTLAAELVSKRQVAREMQLLHMEYISITGRIESAQKEYAQRPENFSLFSFLERLAGTSGIKDKITYMRPGSSVDGISGLTISQVEMRLQDITMEDLASYLFKVEAAEHMVQVNRLSITKAGQQDDPVTVVMRVETAEAS
jgi:general secretion pathway protein M